MEACPVRAEREFDLVVAYDWPYDEPFVSLLEETMRRAGLRLLPISPRSLTADYAALTSGTYRTRAYLDRASDTDPAFAPLDDWALRNVPLHLNPTDRRRHVWHKTNLHWEFIAAGIHTPYTIALPSLERQPLIEPPADLHALGVPFSIKPDLGGGGWGVVTDARGWEDVMAARHRLPHDNLILQEFVEPALLDGQRGWFRVFYACSEIFPCWWNDKTRIFGSPVSSDHRERLGLGPLWDIPHTAATISQLRLFSTEVARVSDGRFVVVDYLNDPVDLRFLPHAREGMPRETAVSLAAAICGFLTRATPSQQEPAST